VLIAAHLGVVHTFLNASPYSMKFANAIPR
jgi:hypothetical protein